MKILLSPDLGYTPEYIIQTLSKTGSEIIEPYFFACQDTFTKLTIPGTFKVVSKLAFKNCPMLESLVLEEGIEDISQTIVNQCPNLKEITLPESLLVGSVYLFFRN